MVRLCENGLIQAQRWARCSSLCRKVTSRRLIEASLMISVCRDLYVVVGNTRLGLGRPCGIRDAWRISRLAALEQLADEYE